MKIISEEGRSMRVSDQDAALLVDAGLVAPCFECADVLHHEEYERWDEVDRLLALTPKIAQQDV